MKVAHDPAVAPLRECLAVGFAAIFPTIVTLVYFVWLAGDSAGWQQAAYAIGKVAQFAFPIAWATIVCGERWNRKLLGFAGAGIGLAIGIVDIGATLALFYGWLGPAGYFAAAAGLVKDKVAGFGISTTGAYIVMSVFYSLVHSALEEYYWRWFVFGRMRNLVGVRTAIVLSSLAFMAHHVIVVAQFFGWTSWLTWVMSGGVAIGGALWAWLYNRTGSLLGPWIAHILADIGVFLVGYHLVQRTFTG